MLPEEKREPKLGFPERATWLIYGPPKAGKTTAAATWPEPLIIECEPGGADFVKAYIQEIDSFSTDKEPGWAKALAQLREVYRDLQRKLRQGKFKYQTIVLDTIDMISMWKEQEVARKYGATQLGEAGVYGADFSDHRNEVLNIIRQFQAFPTHLVILAHTASRKPEFSGGSHVLYLSAEELPSGEVERRFVFNPGPAIEAGSRHPVLAAAGSCPPTFQALRALFKENNKKGGK